MANLDTDIETLTGWLKGKFSIAVKEFYADELAELWRDFVGDTPRSFAPPEGNFLPNADIAQEVYERKEDVEKVLAFKPIADDFLGQQTKAVVDYVDEHTDYLRSLLTDKIGSGIGTSRAELVWQLANEIGTDDPPSTLVALYVIKNAGRFKADDYTD